MGMTHQQLDWIADAVNPALLCVFLACGVAALRGNRGRVAGLMARAGIALLVTYLLAHINHWMPLWAEHRGFPSGHMTFFLTLATSFFLLDRRSSLLTVPAAALYGWLIVFLGYHSLLDLLGAVALAIPVTLLCHRSSGGRRNPGPD